MTMLFEIKKNKSVLLVLVLAVLFCAANFSLIAANYGIYREPLKLVSEAARSAGTCEITEAFKQNYYEIIVVPELKQIQKETGKSLDSLTGVKDGTLTYDRYQDVRNAVMDLAVSPTFFDMDANAKALAERAASVLSGFESKIYSQSGKQYFPDDESTGFAGGFAVLKGIIFLECSVLTLLVFALCSLGESKAHQDTFGILFSTVRGKKVFNAKVLEAFVFSFACALIVIIGTSLVHFCYFDYSPFLNASLDGPFFFTGAEDPSLIIPGITFLQYYLLTVLFLMLSLAFVFCVYGIVFVLTRAKPVCIFIAAAILAAAFLLAGWLGTLETDTHIKEIFPFVYFVAGNSFLLRATAAESTPTTGETVIMSVFAVYVAVSAAGLGVCLGRARRRKTT